MSEVESVIAGCSDNSVAPLSMVVIRISGQGQGVWVAQQVVQTRSFENYFRLLYRETATIYIGSPTSSPCGKPMLMFSNGILH